MSASFCRDVSQFLRLVSRPRRVSIAGYFQAHRERSIDEASRNFCAFRPDHTHRLQRWFRWAIERRRTAGAEKLVRLSRQAGALPVLFPEWPREGVPETRTIYDKYVSVAMQEPACVPPIPQAFDLSRARFPAIALHNADGNHSAPAGAFLASLVLYATITGASPIELPALSGLNIDADVELKLKGIASETVQTIAPGLWCPADRPG